MTLYANSMATRDLWVEKILSQKEKLMLKVSSAAEQPPLTKQMSNSSSTSSTTTPTLVINTS